MKANDVLGNLGSNLNRLESGAVDVVARLAPWAAPAPTAYLVYARTVLHLAWPSWVGVLAAVAIEVLGLSAASTALDLFRYNATRRKTDPAAPLGLAVVLIVLYFVSAEALTVGLDVAPKIAGGALVTVADWTPAIFPVLSLAGVSILALRADHKRRLAAIEADKAERKAERKARQAARNLSNTPSGTVLDTSKTGNVLDAVNLGKQQRKATLLDSLLDVYRADPEATATSVARNLGIGRSTLYTYLAELEGTGRVRNNGNGVEVLS